MENIKYKEGDRVLIKSLDWYNENKNHCGEIPLFKPSGLFVPDMSKYCNNIMTIKDICYGTCYRMKEDFWNYNWTDEMIEGLVEEETKPEPKFKVGDKVILDLYPCKITDVHWRDSLHGFVYTVRGDDFGKIVKEDELVFDERTVPNTNKLIQLIKNDWNNFKDRYNIPDDYHFVDKNGNEINISDVVLEKKKKEYPKTYEECIGKLPINWDGKVEGHKCDLLTTFQKLLICRDAYWKIAEDEMGLGKPWKPIWSIYEHKFCLGTDKDKIIEECVTTGNRILAFPTKEMRDAFYENFKELIEQCKELL